MDTKEKVDRIQLIHELDKKQEELNKQYNKEGLTDEILEKQIEINTIRSQENIPDPKETIHKNYVQ